MTILITTPEKIIEELTDIQKHLEIEMSEESEEAVFRGNLLAVQMARSGKLLADAKIHRDRKLSSVVTEQKDFLKTLSASTANKYVDAQCYNENYLMSWAERINRACTHQLDWCRTIISKSKEELKYLNNQ